ncbi:hypothetical protein [Streptomyces noursei]|uniref:hypothetical protein n=1 Tax=Streptomyces noursei TaxID=1971 RepID=UPI003EBB32C5
MALRSSVAREGNRHLSQSLTDVTAGALRSSVAAEGDRHVSPACIAAGPRR